MPLHFLCSRRTSLSFKLAVFFIHYQRLALGKHRKKCCISKQQLLRLQPCLIKSLLSCVPYWVFNFSDNDTDFYQLSLIFNEHILPCFPCQRVENYGFWFPAVSVKELIIILCTLTSLINSIKGNCDTQSGSVDIDFEMALIITPAQ